MIAIRTPFIKRNVDRSVYRTVRISCFKGQIRLMALLSFRPNSCGLLLSLDIVAGRRQAACCVKLSGVPKLLDYSHSMLER